MARKEKGTRRKINREKVEQKAKSGQETSIFDYYSVPEGFEKFKLEAEGKKRIDILPYELTQDGNPYADKGDIWYERTYYVHKISRENGTDTVVCPSKTKGDPCPICDYMKQLSRSPDADEDEIKSLRPKKRQLFNIIDKADPDTRYIWDISYHLFGKALDIRVKTADDDDDYWRFSDVEDGSTLSIFFEEKRFGQAKYYEAKTIDFKKRKKADAFEDSDIDASANLDDILIFKTYEQLEKILHGEDASSDDEVKGEKKKKKKKKGKKLDKPGFINPSDDQNDSDGKGSGKSKNKSGKKSGKKSDEEEDEIPF